MVTSPDDDDAPLLSESLRRNVVPRVAGSASVADFGQTIAESTQFPHVSDEGLVVEVAPSIVDATAVALPPSDVVESLELDLRVPAILWIQWMSMTRMLCQLMQWLNQMVLHSTVER